MSEETVPALEQISEEHVSPQENTESQEQSNNAPSNQQKTPVEDRNEKNWAEARVALKELRKQNEELRLHLSQMNTRTQETPEEQSSPDDWVTEKKLQQRLYDLESKIKAKEAETVVDRLKMKYQDFDDVVSPENIEYLKEHDPELTLSLQALRDDPYQQGIAAYKLLKRTDYYMNIGAEKEKKKIEQNMTKPPSVNQVRKGGALSEANKFDRGLTPDLKKQLLQEMADARKRS